jgi:DNA-binding transcriptional LysR family regulator
MDTTPPSSAQAAIDAARRDQHQLQGVLRLTTTPEYAQLRLIAALEAFRARHPALQLHLSTSPAPADLIPERFDLAIRLGRLADSRLVATRLAPRRMYLCASPAYLERYGRPHSLSELARHNCLVGSSDLWALQQDGREISQRVQGNWRCNSGQAVLDAALQGIGLCQLPDYYVLEHLNSGALVSLLEAHQPPNTAVWALYPQQRHLSPKVRRLVDYLKEGLAGLPEYRFG